MNREILRKLYIRLSSFRERFKKQKYFFERQGELIRVAFNTPRGVYGFTKHLPPNELMIWLEGVLFGANAADYEPFDMSNKK